MSEAYNRDAFHAAACRGDLEAVRDFVEVEGLDVDCRNRNGFTPLMSAASSSRDHSPGAAGVLRYLITKNANVEAVTVNYTSVHSGSTALMMACTLGKLEAAKVLLEEGRANVNYSRPTDGATALVLATYFSDGHCVVPTLLKHGANPNPILRSPSYKTPLVNTCMYPDSSDMVQQLLDHGADLKKDGGEAMRYAANSSDTRTAIRLLISHLSLQLEPYHVKNTMSSCLRGMLCAGNCNAGNLGIVLDYCRATMTDGEFADLLLSPRSYYSSGSTCLYRISQAQVAKLLIEQPRREDNQLLPVCQQQLVQQNDNGSTPLRKAKRCGSDYADVTAYLETFESLVLSISGTVAPHDNMSSSAKKRKLNDCLAVRLNPELNDFQRSVAQEALDLILDTVESIPDSAGHVILGYLSVLDVMKRSE